MALRGTFEETSPEDLLQILALGRRTGVLVVLDEGRSTRVVFQGGEIIDAVQGTQRGEDVVLGLLAQRSGSFVFRAEEVSSERTVHRSVPALLLMAAQRLDDFGRVGRLLTTPAARVRLVENTPRATRDMGAPERRILELVDGRRSVGEIVAASQMPASEAYALLAALSEQGVIAVVTAEEEGSPLVSPDGDVAAVQARLGCVIPPEARRPRPEELREIADHVRELTADDGEGLVKHGLR